MKQPVARRLAAILAADVAGYSRLMGVDEEGTAQALREHRAAADPIIGEHSERIVKTTGDGLLIEFGSVVGAVQCAIALQQLAAERNAGSPTERRMEWRIGVHLGDVLIEGDDILGDGVNIAARLEGIAEPGGICISDDAFRQVRGKVEAEFVDIGEQSLKNIARPLRVYRIGPSPAPVQPTTPPTALPLPDKPSIAVLPFANMSGDPEQEYFADGMVEEIITALSRIRWLFVIARNSSFAYKGQNIDVKQVGHELRSPFSNRAMVKGYGRWLAWLDGKGLLDAGVAPGDRITPDRVRAYVSHLEAENASGTVIARIIELKVTAAIMDPGRDWSWIYRFASSTRIRHKPARPKRHRLVHIQSLRDLGLDIMENANNESTTLCRFKSYRDGLMIALLASRQLRLRNLAGLTLDRTLVQRGDGWWIQIPAAQTKTRDPIEEPWPEMLVPHLKTYLADHRAGIAALRGPRMGGSTDALWLSMHGSPMTDNGIYRRVFARTREGLGQPVNPHLFRDCAVTSLAIDDPGNIGIASRLLGHRAGSTAERYYNQARTVEASRLMQESLLARRNDVLGDDDPSDTIP